MNNEPDQIDMMNEQELRIELRSVLRKLAGQQAALFTVRAILTGCKSNDAVKAVAHIQKHFADKHEELTSLLAEAKSEAVPEAVIAFIADWSSQNKYGLTQHDQGVRWACIEIGEMLAAAPQPETDGGSNETGKNNK